jgi:aspartyl aminopeptidase
MNNINEKKFTSSLKYIKKVISNISSYYELPEEVKSIISKEDFDNLKQILRNRYEYCIKKKVMIIKETTFFVFAESKEEADKKAIEIVANNIKVESTNIVLRPSTMEDVPPKEGEPTIELYSTLDSQNILYKNG